MICCLHSGRTLPAAWQEKATTTLDTNKVPPSIIDTLFVASRVPSPLFDDAAAIEENTSGAPFPSARRVTPARESDSLKVDVIVSRAGERY